LAYIKHGGEFEQKASVWSEVCEQGREEFNYVRRAVFETKDLTAVTVPTSGIEEDEVIMACGLKKLFGGSVVNGDRAYPRPLPKGKGEVVSGNAA
jgi:hypothetical protein